jgi:hypothetical protein
VSLVLPPSSPQANSPHIERAMGARDCLIFAIVADHTPGRASQASVAPRHETWDRVSAVVLASVAAAPVVGVIDSAPVPPVLPTTPLLPPTSPPAPGHATSNAVSTTRAEGAGEAIRASVPAPRKFAQHPGTTRDTTVIGCLYGMLGNVGRMHATP